MERSESRARFTPRKRFQVGAAGRACATFETFNGNDAKPISTYVLRGERVSRSGKVSNDSFTEILATRLNFEESWSLAARNGDFATMSRSVPKESSVES